MSIPPLDTPIQIIGSSGLPLGKPVILFRVNGQYIRIADAETRCPFRGKPLIVDDYDEDGFMFREQGKKEFNSLSIAPWTWKEIGASNS